MCGIIGLINVKNAKKQARQGLKKISYRGLDGTGFYEEKDLCLGHCLHSVVGNLKQPMIKNEFVFGANCEIYNWKELAKEYSLNSRNDAELLMGILVLSLKDKKLKDIDKGLLEGALEKLDGVYSFFLYNTKEKYTLIARDIFGERPLWFFNHKKSLMFASEWKALESKNIDPEELNPRNIILFDNKKGKIGLIHRGFVDSIRVSDSLTMDTIKEKIAILLENSVKKMSPERKAGLLFSAGLDSTILAFLLKKNGVRFTAYLTATETREEDIKRAIEIAKKIGFELKVVKATKENVLKEIPVIMDVIESCDPVKVEVAITMHMALKEAKKDNVKVMFSGIGADDIFGGYRRMIMNLDFNADGVSFLRRLYERDLYRDDVLSMYNNMELRLPYLDKRLVSFLFTVDNRHKFINMPKPTLRAAAQWMGMPEEFVALRKHAAQYSSGINKLIDDILKEKHERFKSRFFLGLRKKRNIKVGVLFSSGKDSTFAMYVQNRLNYDVKCLITVKSKNKDSFMFHTPGVDMAKCQAKALGLPIVIQNTEGIEEKELNDLKEAIRKAKEKYKIQGIVSGALYSNYQRSRIDKICDELNLKAFSPLWHMNQEDEMRNLVRNGFSFILVKVAADGLDKSWLGKEVGMEDIDHLVKLNKINGINIAGEGGEFESLVLDCPMFKKKIKIVSSKIIESSKNCAELAIKKAVLERKKYLALKKSMHFTRKQLERESL